MMRVAKVTIILAASLVSSLGPRTQAQGLVVVEIAQIQLADSLSGLVQDRAGSPLPRVLVQEFDSDWQHPLRSTQTDAGGAFSLSSVPGRQIYYLQLSANGFDSLRVRIQIDAKRGGKLTLRLDSAT